MMLIRFVLLLPGMLLRAGNKRLVFLLVLGCFSVATIRAEGLNCYKCPATVLNAALTCPSGACVNNQQCFIGVGVTSDSNDVVEKGCINKGKCTNYMGQVGGTNTPMERKCCDANNCNTLKFALSPASGLHPSNLLVAIPAIVTMFVVLM